MRCLRRGSKHSRELLEIQGASREFKSTLREFEGGLEKISESFQFQDVAVGIRGYQGAL